MEKLTIKDAARRWVGEFNAIPQNFISRALGEDGLYDGQVEVLATDLECTHCGSTDFTAEGSEEEGDDVLTCTSCGCEEFHQVYDLPMWGTMWTFGSELDEEWVETEAGLQAMRDCGFWVYEDEDLGIFFGINGAGYDFYENHWIPLYRKRGLKWHKEEA